MFNKKLKKRIKELEERMDTYDKRPQARGDYFTKNIHYLSDMVQINGEVESTYYDYFLNKEKVWKEKPFYFLKGTEPKCNSIKEYEDGRLEFIKNGVICNKKGDIVNEKNTTKTHR